LTDALERLELSPVAGFLWCLLRLLHIDGRSVSVLLFWRKSVSKPSFLRKDEVLDVIDPLPDLWLLVVEFMDS